MESTPTTNHATESSPVTVIILTFNEELNLPHAIASVKGWATEIIVLDSFSTDRTVAIAKENGCSVYQHRFEDYGSQRNFAISELPVRTDWAFFLDADEQVPSALRAEISDILRKDPIENGFFVRFRQMWMGRWIKHGYYPTWILRLFRLKVARCESRSVNEHLVVTGALGRLSNDLIHDDRKPLSVWISKHTAYAAREAEELWIRKSTKKVMLDARLSGSQAERKRWIRYHVWERLPPVARPFAYFSYRYFLRGGFLEGREAFAFHFLQGLWFPLLIDLNYLEILRKEKANHEC